MRPLLPVIALVLGAVVAAAAQTAPRNPHGGIRWDCQDCHTLTSWSRMREPLRFAHGETGFPLVGAHAKTNCISCHHDLRFVETESSCANCHADIHRGQLGAECQTCHTAENWQSRREGFEQHAQRGFPLVGVHAIANCDACHANQLPREFAGTPTDCAACHAADFQATSDPPHVAAGFTQECQSCHGIGALSWANATYQHPASFPLANAHNGPSCNDCHATAYAGTSPDCFACHESDYRTAPDPDHDAAGFSTQCAECHTTIAWKPAALDHGLTSFPLTGAHVAVSCNACHIASFSGTPSACVACHESNFTAAADPDHVGGEFPEDCEHCHGTAAWTPATFDHDLSDFPLTGAHVSVTCNSCHVSGYTGTADDCVACHESDYLAAGDPKHVEAGFPRQCAQCHNTAAWEPADLDHDLTDFPLTGAHVSVTCENCHTAGYTGTPSACVACHESDYTNAADPNHVSGGFPTDCAQCHTTSGWEPAGIDHDLTDFPLTGAHTMVTCNRCHASGYTGTPLECDACHHADYANVADPNHTSAGFSTACAECHTTAGWVPALLDHDLTDFPLTGAHVAVSCNSCHSAGYTGTAAACIACHETDYTTTTDPDHAGAGISMECTQCHTTAAWEPTDFDHDLTQFPLTGLHVSVTCNSCHAAGYSGTPLECDACHRADYTGVVDPDHVGAGFSTACADCHTTAGWTPASLDHDITGFPLTGAHTSVTCANCHTSGYTGTASACVACHESDYRGVNDPDHIAAGFPDDCVLCHTTAGWEPANVDHSLTDFPLTGAHSSVTCENCHTSGYTGTPSNCFACHGSDYQAAADPDHAAGGFPTDCARCHTTTAWEPAWFDHASTQFPLTGAHASVTCENCHASGYGGTPLACFACHDDDYNAVTDPNHVSAGFGTICSECHTTSGWTPALLNHDITGFPLTGAHLAVSCNTCHASGYTGTASECLACHQSDYTAAVSPDHNGLATDCAQCHTTTGWKPSSFNHNQTQFVLTGAHTSVSCNNCHAAGYTATPMACFACHDDDYNGVGDPDHALAGFSTVCTPCHNTTAWSQVSWSHNQTGFTLTGAHQSVTCNSCHSTGFANTSSACYACHSSDFAGATNPDHVAGGIPTLCEQCHTTSAWTPASFDHNLSGFPLTGAHATVNCNSCHANGYTGTPTDCDACHHADYLGVLDPNHVSAGFSTLCQQCHTTMAWTPASFDHNQSGFPLTGAHTTVTCNSCHANGSSGTPMECAACHNNDYLSATPNHVAAGFPTTCQTCHTTSAWTPANWDHDAQYFPIYSGAHKDKWNDCVDCHVSAGNFAAFECIFCHQHNQTDTDRDHTGEPGYQYLSSACYACHPRGSH
ncbi:MAG TPA: hypothetical protein VNN55_10945 [bacterium]|nr:hypothetical protein [bacterium]